MELYDKFLEGLKTAVYLRKSQKDIEEEKKASLRGEGYDTLERHRQELLRYSRLKKLVIVDIFQEVVSGDTIESREEMKRLLDNVEHNKYDCVLVIAYDRLGRGDKRDQGYIEHIFKDSNTLILTPHKFYDLNSEEGETSADFDGFISRMEYRRINGRMWAGKIRSVHEGKNLSNKVNYGFSKNPVTKKLEVNEEEAQFVRLMFEWSCQGEGTKRMERKLHSMNVKTRKGNYFTSKTIADIIKNPKYKGDQFYAKTRKKRKNPDMVYVVGSHAAIVDSSTWELANRMLTMRKPKIPTSTELLNPLASLCKCYHCNKTMQMGHSREKLYIRCNTINCQSRGILFEKVEAKLLEGIHEILLNANASIDLNNTNSDLEQLNHQLDKAIYGLSEVEEQINNLHEFLEKKIYTPEKFMERIEILNTRNSELLDLKSNLENQIEIELNKKELSKNLLPMIVNALEVYHQSTPEQKNIILKSFIKEIIYHREKDWNLSNEFRLEIILQ